MQTPHPHTRASIFVRSYWTFVLLHTWFRSPPLPLAPSWSRGYSCWQYFLCIHCLLTYYRREFLPVGWSRGHSCWQADSVRCLPVFCNRSGAPSAVWIKVIKLRPRQHIIPFASGAEHEHRFVHLYQMISISFTVAAAYFLNPTSEPEPTATRPSSNTSKLAVNMRSIHSTGTSHVTTQTSVR